MFSSFGVVRYVDLKSTNATPPFTNWITAATNIQDAIDAALPGDEIIVTNGVYQTGGRAVYGTMTNRVVVHKPLVVRSVNGPALTVIRGYQVPGSVLSTNAIRCVYLTNGASISGFTLANGATQTKQFLIPDPAVVGGGIWCEAGAVVSNCVVAGNVAFLGGGGAHGGTFHDCTLSGNQVAHAFGEGGGGVLRGTLYRCTLSGNSSVMNGGGASLSTLTDCILTGNSAVENGGGAVSSRLDYCLVISNSAYFGGGTVYGTLKNCTIIGNLGVEGGGAAFSWSVSSDSLNNCLLIANSAVYGGGARYCTMKNCTLANNSAMTTGGGTDSSDLYNCIVYYNTAPSGSNSSNATLNYSCTTPKPAAGSSNITNAPLFVDLSGGNLRLRNNSPCINGGTNGYAVGSTDLDGRPRTVGGTVDIGAYEFQGPGMSEFIAWLQQYGLRTDGSADFADTDIEGMNNWQEWRAGTDPTNALSALRLLSPSSGSSGVILRWQSVTNRNYFLERSADLGTSPVFSLLSSNIVGQPGTTTYVDTNTVGSARFFYRVGVQE